MMYMHYCKRCHRVFMLNGHKMICPKCTDPLTELQISYLDYVELDMSELGRLKTTYRMYKYSKWYKELQAQNKHNLPITTLLAAMNHSSAENCSIEKLS